MGRGLMCMSTWRTFWRASEKDSNASDYLNDMKDLDCQLFRDMKEYEYWKQTISAVEDLYDRSGKPSFFQLFLTELWMDYYQTVGERRALCGTVV